MTVRRNAMFRFAFVVVLALATALPARAQNTDAQIRSLVHSLGYGAAIHHFKNYVLRGGDEHRTQADAFFGQAQKTIADLRGAPALTTDEKQALEAIAGVVGQYRANITTVQKMIGDGRSITEIDAAVKVDDTPAAKGLAALRAGRKWTTIDTLESALGYAGAIHHFKNYVLRGSESYRTNAAASFQEVARQIAALRADTRFGEKERKAIDDLDGVVRKYVANIDVARKMIGDHAPVKAIDAAVKVDDAPAIAALAVLRK